jgi:hypothetical protein
MIQRIRAIVILVSLVTWLPAASQDRVPAIVTGVADGDTIGVQLYLGAVLPGPPVHSANTL